jgi:hypothetical protein
MPEWVWRDAHKLKPFCRIREGEICFHYFAPEAFFLSFFFFLLQTSLYPGFLILILKYTAKINVVI